MHDVEDPLSTMPNYISNFKECIGCMKSLPAAVFQKDASYRDGHRDLCSICEASPRMSTAEHTARLREMNFNSHAVKKQRWAYQDDYRDDEARDINHMHHSELIHRLKKLIPDLYVTEGRLIGDLAFFRTFPCPQPDLNNRDFQYLFYCPEGNMPEYSTYLFDDRDIPQREEKRGWRTILLRLIFCGLLTEEACNQEFGAPSGPASVVWRRELWQFRNKQKATE